MKFLKFSILALIIVMFVFGTLEAFTSDAVMHIVEGFIMLVASYLLLFLAAKHNMLPRSVNVFIEWITDNNDY